MITLSTPAARAALHTLMVVLLCGSLAAQAKDTLFRALGERPGIERLMVDFVQRLRSDAQIGSRFKDTNPKFLADQLSDQICQLAGGPCKFDGPTMKEAHQEMEIGKAEFNALVERLQDAMDAQRLPFGTQNRLLALLAPMHREIVTRP